MGWRSVVAPWCRSHAALLPVDPLQLHLLLEPITSLSPQLACLSTVWAPSFWLTPTSSSSSTSPSSSMSSSPNCYSSSLIITIIIINLVVIITIFLLFIINHHHHHHHQHHHHHHSHCHSHSYFGFTSSQSQWTTNCCPEVWAMCRAKSRHRRLWTCLARSTRRLPSRRDRLRTKGGSSKALKDLLAKTVGEFNKLCTVKQHRIDTKRKTLLYNLSLALVQYTFLFQKNVGKTCVFEVMETNGVLKTCKGWGRLRKLVRSYMVIMINSSTRFQDRYLMIHHLSLWYSVNFMT